MSRLPGRLSMVCAVGARWLGWRRRGAPPPAPADAAPRRILIVHHLLLGDTLMLTALLKKLRAAHPQAEIVLTVRRAFAALYSTRPYGVHAIAFEPGDAVTVRALIKSGPYDLAFVPGDNRHSWLAYAAGARCIVAHAGDRPAWKNWPLARPPHRAQPYPTQPAAWADMVAALAPGREPAPYAPTDWPAPPHAAFDMPATPYVVLHLGASNALRTWLAPRWIELAERLEAKGLEIVLSAGRSELSYVQAVDSAERWRSTAGALDLAQLWHLLAGARMLVCPDTGIAHLARIVGVRTIALFGPGSPVLFGAGRFWRDAPFVALGESSFPCRNQHHLFRRDIAWVQRCDRRPPTCNYASCMEGLSVERVLAAAEHNHFV